VRTVEYFGPCRRRRITEDYSGPERRASELPTGSAASLHSGQQSRAEHRGVA